MILCTMLSYSINENWYLQGKSVIKKDSTGYEEIHTANCQCAAG